MSEEAMPPKVQQMFLRYQQLQQQLQLVQARKRQIQLELAEVENALRELEKLGDDVPIYKSVGSLLIRADKASVVKELEDRREFLNLRLRSVEREEERAQQQLEELEPRLRKALGARG